MRTAALILSALWLGGCFLDQGGLNPSADAGVRLDGAAPSADAAGVDAGPDVDAGPRVDAAPGDGGDVLPDGGDVLRDAGGVDGGDVLRDAGGGDGGGPEDAGGVDGGGAEDAGTDAGTPPEVTGVDYPVIAHGARLEIRGTAFTGASEVIIGGRSQGFSVSSDGLIVVGELDDTTPTGTQNLTVRVGGLSSPIFALTVIHLVVNEVDAVDAVTTASFDEFVEVSTGVGGVSLSGYALVLYDRNDVSTRAIHLDATADGSGLLLIGGSEISPTPAITWTDGYVIDNETGAAAIYQDDGSAYGAGTAVTGARLIDAVVHDVNRPDDDGLLTPLLGSGLERVQINEGAVDADTQSVQRCSPARLDGRAFSVAVATPGAANDCS